MTSLEDLGFPRRVSSILDRNGITDIGQLVAMNERELLGLPRFGLGALRQVNDVLEEAGLALAEDPYAPYVCAREGKTARDANLANFFLCDDCAAQWEIDAFDNEPPLYVGARTEGYCLNCNVNRSDVRLRQWMLCPNCERVARSIGRSIAAELYVRGRWRTVVSPHAPGLTIEGTDEPTLRRGPRGAQGARRSEIDFSIRDSGGTPVFGFEMKTGKSHISGTAQVGPRMGQFQLDVSDCDDITAVMERDELPVYLLHVQVIDRVHPPTLQYVSLAAWWTDVFQMNNHFDRIQRRSREAREAAYFHTTMFQPFATFVDHVASGGHERLARRLRADGIPALYRY